MSDQNRPFGVVRDLSEVERQIRRDLLAVRHHADVIRSIADEATDDDWTYLRDSAKENAAHIDLLCRKLIGD